MFLRKMENKKEILAIIPARGGSKGIKRKNIYPLSGKPLIYYSIKEAKDSKLISRVVVSTEDREIAEVAKSFGCEVISRPEELAQDQTPTLPVLQHVVNFLKEKENYQPDAIVIIQPTAPLRLASDIDGAVNKLLEAGCDSVVSVAQVPAHYNPAWIKKVEGDVLLSFEGLRIDDDKNKTRRQDLKNYYWKNGAVYAIKTDILMEKNSIFGETCRPFVMPEERSINIDSLLDLKMIELLMKEKK